MISFYNLRNKGNRNEQYKVLCVAPEGNGILANTLFDKQCGKAVLFPDSKELEAARKRMGIK